MNADPHEYPFDMLALMWPVVSSFGGGLNSTALLVKWVLDKNAPIDKIIFADTGGERDYTYENVHRLSEWLQQHGMPAVQVTKKGGRDETLEQYALRTEYLPSLAYGTKGCSWKFKIEPQNREVNQWPMAKRCWKAGDKVVKLIGYGFEEQKRLAKAKLEDEKYIYRFPLNEWEIDRAGCERIIRHVGLPVPGKSSCFFCPSSKKHEILALLADLQTRAIRIEQVASAAGNMRTTKGLGRQFAWGDFLNGATVPEPTVVPCMYCVDGPEDGPDLSDL